MNKSHVARLVGGVLLVITVIMVGAPIGGDNNGYPFDCGKLLNPSDFGMCSGPIGTRWVLVGVFGALGVAGFIAGGLLKPASGNKDSTNPSSPEMTSSATSPKASNIPKFSFGGLDRRLVSALVIVAAVLIGVAIGASIQESPAGQDTKSDTSNVNHYAELETLSDLCSRIWPGGFDCRMMVYQAFRSPLSDEQPSCTYAEVKGLIEAQVYANPEWRLIVGQRCP